MTNHVYESYIIDTLSTVDVLYNIVLSINSPW